MLFVVHSIVFSKLKYKILHGFAWVHLTWKRCILNGLTGSCKICSIFMPRLGMNLARLCAKSCQNVMGSHGKSWQDLANFFLRVEMDDVQVKQIQSAGERMGHAKVKDEQFRVIEDVVRGRDTFVREVSLLRRSAMGI